MDPTTKFFAIVAGIFTSLSLISAAAVVIVKNLREIGSNVRQMQLFHRLEPKLTEVIQMDLGAIQELRKNGGQSVKDKVDKVDRRSEQRDIDTQEILQKLNSLQTEQDRVRNELIETRKEILDHREEMSRFVRHDVGGTKNLSRLLEYEEENLRRLAAEKSKLATDPCPTISTPPSSSPDR